MAPRAAKTKKAASAKVENEPVKKGRGKGKNIEEAENLEIVPDELNAVADKKPKRGAKKGTSNTNGVQKTNGDVEEAPPAKKGRKKVVEETVQDEIVNDDSSSLNEEVEQIDDTDESQPASVGRGRKKQTKQDIDKKDTMGKKKANVVDKEIKEVKPKPASKGRGRKAQAKPEEEVEEKDESVPEEEKPVKGKRNGGKTIKGKNLESDKEDSPEKEDDADVPVEEPKKKGKRPQKKVKEGEGDNNDEVKEEVPASKKRKTNKKEEKGKGDSKEDEATEDIPEVKPKGKRGQKKAAETVVEDNEPQDTGEVVTKRRRKAPEEKAVGDEPKAKAPAKNKTTTDYAELDFSNTSKNSAGKEWNFKISSWNVDGIRAWLSKGGMEYIKIEKPNILCLQEIKCAQDKLPEEITNVPGYHAYWLSGDKDGYAGVGIYTTKLAMNVQYGLKNEELDTEGRIITAEYEHFYLICTYVPNAGKKLITLPKRLQWNEEFRKHVQDLDKKKPVIICGDMNVAHNEIDLTNPKTNKKNAGFTEEERAGMTELLGDGFVDTFRHLNPDKTGAYTFWTYMMNSRSKNVGWRLDYFIVSERFMPSLCDSMIRDKVYGSDHCPITLFLHLSTADKPKE